MARGTLRTDIDEAACAARLEKLFEHEMKLFSTKPKPKEKVGLYSLMRGKNGGGDPHAGAPWSLVDGVGKFSDCIGTYMWARGVDRFQPDRFKHLYGGYCNTDSVLMDALGEKAVTGQGKAKAPQKMWRPTKVPRPGIAVVYPAKYEKGKKVKGNYGHIMGIVAVAPSLGSGGQWPGLETIADGITVIHCHGGRGARKLRAIDREPLSKAIGPAALKRAHLIELVPGLK